MIAAGKLLVHAALERRQRAGDQRDAELAGQDVDAGELVVAARGEATEMSACACSRMLTPNLPAAAMARATSRIFSMQTRTSGGCSESDANEATVIP